MFCYAWRLDDQKIRKRTPSNHLCKTVHRTDSGHLDAYQGISNVVKETGYEEWSSPRPFLEYDIVVRVPYLVEEAGGKLATPI